MRKEVELALGKYLPNINVNWLTGKMSIKGNPDVTKYGQAYKLLSRMISSEHTIRITDTSESGGTTMAISSDLTAASTPLEKGGGSGGTVHWDPSNSDKLEVIQSDGSVIDESPSPGLALLHELIHGDHYQRGATDPSQKEVPYTRLDRTTGSARNEEIRAVGYDNVDEADVTENQIRKERSENLRNSYETRDKLSNNPRVNLQKKYPGASGTGAFYYIFEALCNGGQDVDPSQRK
jgi:hypothetical protein